MSADLKALEFIVGKMYGEEKAIGQAREFLREKGKKHGVLTLERKNRIATIVPEGIRFISDFIIDNSYGSSVRVVYNHLFLRNESGDGYEGYHPKPLIKLMQDKPHQSSN